MSVNGRPFGATRVSRCPAGAGCVHGGQISVGDQIGPVAGVGWIHDDDSRPVATRPTIADVSRDVPMTTQQARALGQLPRCPVRRSGDGSGYRPPQRTVAATTATPASKKLPSGRYTVRTADMPSHVVVEISDTETAAGTWYGTQTVSVHGVFAPRIGKLREHRSWLQFAVIRDGRVNVYHKMRELIDACMQAIATGSTYPAVEAEDAAIAARVAQAAKAVRWLIAADLDAIMAAGAAYARANSRCWRCRQPLDDPESQKRGIGPTCLKILRREYGE